MPKPEPLALDTGAVDAYLSRHLPRYAGPLTAEKFTRGQSNPTYLLTTPERRYVLRRKPPGQLLKSAHAVDREFRVQSALAATDVPVARMHLLCQEETELGADFYIMDHVDGRVFEAPSLDALPRQDRAPIMEEMNRVLAALHSVDIEAVGLSDYGPPGNYYARQTARWTKQYRATETEAIPDMDALITGLARNLPDEDGQRTLVHGDYRIDNLIFDAQKPLVRAVLDWELSTIGHPFADLAAVIMQWRMPPDADGRGLAGLDRAARGLTSDDDFIADYCARRQIARPARFGFYLGFAFFRMAAILQGVKKRALDGNASNPTRALRLGTLVPQFAAEGRTALERD